MAGHGHAARGSGPSAGKVKAELESMRDFKKRVDRLLDDLDESDAKPDRIAGDRAKPENFGSGFNEASGLYQAYHQVHDQLESLSKVLSGQISALSTAIEAAGSGYQNMDEEVQRRMRATQQDSEKLYDAKNDPYAKEDEKQSAQQGSAAQQGGSHDKGDGQASM